MFHVKHSLPERSAAEFSKALAAISGVDLPAAALRALHAHYTELARWSPGISLIGPGTVGQPLERHYAESLAALELIERGPENLVDIGSGAGFPGFVLAAALAPETHAFLVEARQRKWAFLKAAARRAGLPMTCLHARVADPLPPGLPDEIHLLTLRAVRLPAKVWRRLVERLTEGGRVLVWAGERGPELPIADASPGLRTSGLKVKEVGRLKLSGSNWRQIVAFGRSHQP